MGGQTLKNKFWGPKCIKYKKIIKNLHFCSTGEKKNSADSPPHQLFPCLHEFLNVQMKFIFHLYPVVVYFQNRKHRHSQRQIACEICIHFHTQRENKLNKVMGLFGSIPALCFVKPNSARLKWQAMGLAQVVPPILKFSSPASSCAFLYALLFSILLLQRGPSLSNRRPITNKCIFFSQHTNKCT